jgi:hypothetical protein
LIKNAKEIDSEGNHISRYDESMEFGAVSHGVNKICDIALTKEVLSRVELGFVDLAFAIEEHGESFDESLYVLRRIR